MIPPFNDPFWITIGLIALAVISPFISLLLFVVIDPFVEKWVDERKVSFLEDKTDKRKPYLFFANVFKTIPYICIFQIFIGTFMYYSMDDEPIAANIAWATPILIWISIVYLWSHKEDQKSQTLQGSN